MLHVPVYYCCSLKSEAIYMAIDVRSVGSLLWPQIFTSILWLWASRKSVMRDLSEIL